LFEKLVAEENARADASRIAAKTGFARIHFSEEGVSIQEITDFAMADGDLAKPKDAETSDVPALDLKRGTWVEFLQKSGRKVRAKLSWISPHRGVYLFTSPGADEALSISPDILRQQFQSGQARRVNEASIIDRAVDHMVHALQGTANG
jgi:hypothetical protein